MTVFLYISKCRTSTHLGNKLLLGAPVVGLGFHHLLFVALVPEYKEIFIRTFYSTSCTGITKVSSMTLSSLD
jgi:hypothetical protein